MESVYLCPFFSLIVLYFAPKRMIRKSRPTSFSMPPTFTSSLAEWSNTCNARCTKMQSVSSREHLPSRPTYSNAFLVDCNVGTVQDDVVRLVPALHHDGHVARYGKVAHLNDGHEPNFVVIRQDSARQSHVFHRLGPGAGQDGPDLSCWAAFTRPIGEKVDQKANSHQRANKEDAQGHQPCPAQHHPVFPHDSSSRCYKKIK